MEEEYIPLEERSFDEVLLKMVEQDKVSMVKNLIRAFNDGEPSAIKVVTNALLASSSSEENNFPIEHERFKEIILLAAGRIKEGRLSGSGALTE